MKQAFLELADGSIEVIHYESIDGVAVYQGDIILHVDERGWARVAKEQDRLAAERAKREALEPPGSGDKSAVRAFSSFRWPNQVIPFTIDASLPNQGRVTNAIAHWEANTNVRFVARTSHSSYVTFRPHAEDCSSHVGRQGGQQFINLADGCSTGSTIHEIGHAAGMWHEHSRTDRDNFVIILWENIEPGLEFAFETYAARGEDGINHGAYDFDSIMHYHSFAFSDNGNPTITRLDGSLIFPNANQLSAGDVAGAGFMYPYPRPLWIVSSGYFASRAFVTIGWSSVHMETASVDVFRSGVKVTTTANDGSYSDMVFASSPGSFNYWVCQAGSTTWYNSATCSNVKTAYF